jgi:hypothetical protein
MAGLVLAGATLALGLGARPETVLAAAVLALLACPEVGPASGLRRKESQ